MKNKLLLKNTVMLYILTFSRYMAIWDLQCHLLPIFSCF